MARRKRKGKGRKGKKGKKGKKRKANPAFKKPVTVDDALFAVIKTRRCSRGQIIKKVWQYIKKKKLQDPKDTRFINPDDTLAKVTGGKRRINMLKLAGVINKHIKK